MAKEIKKVNPKTINPRPKPEPKQPKEKKSGLFGFGKKKNNVNDEPNEIEEEIVDEPTISQPKQPLQQKTPEQETFTTAPVAENEDRIGIFLYAPTEDFGGLQQYINKKPGIYAFGSNNPHQLLPIFKEKTLSRTILLFIEDEVALDKMSDFLSVVSKIDILNIFVVLDKSIAVSKLLRYCSNIQYYDEKPLQEIIRNEEFINSILDPIINSQPVYIRHDKAEKEKQFKPSFSSKNDMLLTADLDINELRKELEAIKKDTLESKVNIVDTIKDSLLTARNASEVNMENVLPEANFLENIKNQLINYINESRNFPVAKKEMDLYIQNLLKVSVLKKNEIEDIITNIVKSAQEEIKRNDDMLHHFSDISAEQLEKIKNNKDELFKERDKIKQSLDEKLIIYKTQVQLAVNSMQYLLDVNSQMTNSLVDISEELPVEEGTKRAIATLSERVSKEVKDLTENSRKLNRQLTDAVSYASNLLNEYGILVVIDDLLIDTLQQENQLLRNNKIVNRIVVDSRVKEITKLVKTSKGVGTTFILDNALEPDLDLVVDLRNTVKAWQKMKGETLQSFMFDSNLNNHEDDIVAPFSLLYNSDNFVDNMHMDTIDNLIKRLTYLSKYKARIFIIIDETVNKLVVSRLEDEFLEDIIFTDLDKNSMLAVKNYLSKSKAVSKKIIINKFPANASSKIGTIRELTGNSDLKAKEIAIPMLKDASSSNEVLKKLRAKL